MNKNPFQVKLAETLGKFGSVDLDNVKVHLDKNNIIPVYLPKLIYHKDKYKASIILLPIEDRSNIMNVHLGDITYCLDSGDEYTLATGSTDLELYDLNDDNTILKIAKYVVDSVDYFHSKGIVDVDQVVFVSDIEKLKEKAMKEKQ